jgi:peptidoglycan/LPS O-acetylase OafA/YrhL
MTARTAIIAIPLALVLMIAFAIAEGWGSMPHDRSMVAQATCVMAACAGLTALAGGQRSRVARIARILGAIGVISCGVLLCILVPELKN